MCCVFSRDLIKEKLKQTVLIIYYSIQVLSSLLILFSVLKLNFLFIGRRGAVFLFLGIFIKIGLWPFHSWYIKMINLLEMKFLSLWFLITWQKLVPFFLLLFSNLVGIGGVFFIVGLLNLLLSLVYLKGVFDIKRVLGFSSIGINSWILILIFFSMLVWKIYLFIYSLRIVLIFFFLKVKNEVRVVIISSLLVFFLVLNIGGFPPILIFWGKILIIKSVLILGFQIEVVFFLIIRACYTIFFYLFIVLIEFLSLLKY